MKIIKPLTLGILHQPYRYRGVHYLSIAALGFFALGRSDERLLVENLQWPRVLPLIPAGQPLDYVLPKARAEVLLTGSAYSAQPVEAMNVRVQCGGIDKSLRVIGDRVWQRRLWPTVCVDAPKPFKTMPLTLERAYGGEGHANPLGCGYLPRLSWLRTQKGPMPNIEYPGMPVIPGRARRPFASYAPQQLVHAAANRRASGTYDQRWLAEDFPGLPRDFDFATYNLSARDQQLEDRFSGGEAYRLEGLHPTRPMLTGTLPAVRARAFVLAEGQAADATAEVTLACDTVWFFPDAGIGLMVFRGQTVVSDSDALDVHALMVAYECSEHAPRPLAHYREVMALRLDPTQAALHAFNESQLAPERSAQARAARAAARERHAAQAQAKRQAVLDETLAEFWQRSGLTPPADFVAPKATAPQLPEFTPEDLEEGDFDLVELHASALALAEQARSDGDAKLAAAQSTLPPQPPSAAPTPAEQCAAALAKAAQPAADLVSPTTPAPLPTALADALERAAQTPAGTTDPAQLAQARAAAAGFPALQRAARNAAVTPTPLAPAVPDGVAQALGAQVRAWLAQGLCLAGRDLAGADLRKADLRGADLREVQLERADLRGALLNGAQLSGAVLCEARLDDADFSQATLDGANLCGSHAARACFAGASLRHARALDAQWPQADLRAAVLDDALLLRIDLSAALLDNTQLTRTILMEAQAPASRWVGSRWNMSVAPAANFAQACFDGAQLTRSVLMDANMCEGSWQGATLNTVYAGGKSCWTDARLGLLRGVKCGFRGSNLRGAHLAGAVLASCDFGEADLSGAALQGAQFHRSLFLRSNLRGAQAAGASFFQALCRKTDLRDADLSAAVLVQADLSETLMTGTRMAGAKRNQAARLA